MHDLVTVWQRSTTAEMCWLAPDGPTGIPVVPLMWEGLPCAALPMAHLDAVDTMVQGRAAFSATSPRTDRPHAPVATGCIDIHYDLSGERFVEHLLEQEAAKHPPTRLRADSLMSRRENWWWVPRVLITLVDADSAYELPARAGSGDALLVRAAGADPCLDMVTAQSWPPLPEGGIGLWRRGGGSLNGEGEAAFAFSHQHSPDFERWERWHRRGTLRGEELSAGAGEGVPDPDPRPFGILDRFRNHRDVARACKAGIAAAEARQAAGG